MPAPSPQPAPDPAPLSAEHLRALHEARLRTRRIRRAAAVAALSGWTMAAFAGLTLLGALFGSLASVALAIALGGLAFNELHAGAMLRRLDPAGARRLGCNQLALGACLVAYAGWSLIGALRDPPLAAIGSTGDAQMDAMVEQLATTVAYGLYGGMAAVGLLVPGLTAWYYFSRARLVRDALAHTPPWVVETLRAAA